MSVVYVGIVTYNSMADLPACLAALQQQTYPHLHLVIADNASQDSCVPWLQQHHPTIEILNNTQNLGFGAAHNQIIRHCNLRSDNFYLALNPDAILAPDYIAHLVRGLETYQAGWGIGTLFQPNTQHIYSVGHGLQRDGYAFNIGHGTHQGYRVDRPIFGAPAAAALYRGSLIQSLSVNGNFFDPTLFMYGEDVDVDWRAQRQGWNCWYIASATATHRGSSPSLAFRDHALANRYLSVIKNAYWWDLFTYNIPLIAAHCIARLVLTPRRGIALTQGLARRAMPMLKQRQTPTVARHAFKHWWVWSRQQQTDQPRTLLQRWRAFQQRRNLH